MKTFKRCFFGILWLLAIYWVLTNIGTFFNAQHVDWGLADANGQRASAATVTLEFNDRYGLAIFLCSLALTVGATYFGLLPGTRFPGEAPVRKRSKRNLTLVPPDVIAAKVRMGAIGTLVAGNMFLGTALYSLVGSAPASRLTWPVALGLMQRFFSLRRTGFIGEVVFALCSRRPTFCTVWSTGPSC